MHDMPHCKRNCSTEYLQHNCITYAQQFTNISIYISISAADFILSYNANVNTFRARLNSIENVL